MATFLMSLVSPERLLFAEPVDQADLPGADGDFGVLQNHAPVMSTIRDGNLSIYKTEKGEPETIRIEGGFAEVNAKGLTVLAEKAG